MSSTGETITGRAALDVQGASPPPVLVAALGPKMLELAGAVADGTVTWMTGPATLASHIVPTITRAAPNGRSAGARVGVGLPVCVTDDVDGARERAAKMFEIYGMLPSYRAMLDREGADGPADVAIIGDESAVGAALEQLGAMGATDFVASIFGGAEERQRTRVFLRSLV